MRVFVVCGEALMDVFAGGDTSTGMVLDARVGGSPFNVAVGLARLAQPVAFFGALSRDGLGERLLRALRDEKVDTASIARVDAPTTLGLVGTDAQGVPSYAFHGERGADRQLGVDALSALPTAIDAVHLGSYSTVVEPIASTLRALVEREHMRTLISYDPNIRLNVEPDLMRWRSALQWLLPRSHLLKISEEDLSLLLPGMSAEEFAGHALHQGVRLVVITRGVNGATAWTAAVSVSVAAVEVPVVDTVGAGDTFQAALLTWLAEHNGLSPQACGSMAAPQLREALQFAACAAAITCARRGADLPRRGELHGCSALGEHLPRVA
jgi:fructokinase